MCLGVFVLCEEKKSETQSAYSRGSASGLGQHCLHMSHKKDTRLICGEVKQQTQM